MNYSFTIGTFFAGLPLLTGRESTKSAALLGGVPLGGSLVALGSSVLNPTILGRRRNRLSGLDTRGVVAVHSTVKVDRRENLKGLLLTAALSGELVRSTLGRLPDNSSSLAALVMNGCGTTLTGSQSNHTSNSETSNLETLVHY
jgi:hypothetical protein